MTVRDLYDAALIEINKLEAPSMLLEDYNYLINKAIQQKVNKSYNRYEVNQQATDDLLALKRTAVLTIKDDRSAMPNETKGYYSQMPYDYMHLLNCVIQFKEAENTSICNKSDKLTTVVARKLTSNLYPSIINNAYFKPSPKNPYYRVIQIGEDPIESTVNAILEPCAEVENKANVILDLRCGDTERYTPHQVYIDYLKKPHHINLSHEDLVSEQDNTSEMEFSDYVCYEIINEFVKLLLENTSDPRLQTNMSINQTISDPLQPN